MQLLPRRYADTRTYNMLVTVCGAAGDVTSALHAADMLRSTGGKPDTIMYTNLIAGAQDRSNTVYCTTLTLLLLVFYDPTRKNAAHCKDCARMQEGEHCRADRALLCDDSLPRRHWRDSRSSSIAWRIDQMSPRSCAACAAGADAEEAFRLYGEMRRDCVPLECQTFSALLNACSMEVTLIPDTLAVPVPWPQAQWRPSCRCWTPPTA